MKGVSQSWKNQGGARRVRHTRYFWVWLFMLTILISSMVAACLPLQNSTNQIVFSDLQHWSARLSLAGDTPPSDIALLQQRISAKGIDVEAAPVASRLGQASMDLRLAGSGGLDQVRQLLYGGLDAGLQPLSVSTQLTLTGEVQAGERIDIQIASNPTTGYLWEATSGNVSILVVNQSTALTQVSPWLGATGQQTLSIQAQATGQASLHLVYRRSWEPAAPQYRLSLLAPQLASLADLTDPRPVDNVSSLNTLFPQAQASSDLEVAATLPAVYDWRTKGGTTPVRDQGACGSCWAFSTVGVLESNILIKDGQVTDLSEQYLLSCNTDGWTCNGGQIAHNYHLSNKPPSELAAGAVLEKNFPYQGTTASSCKGPYQHDYRIQGWSYIGNMYTPDVAQIKQAITQYGPVASTVCVGPAFTSYRKGLFATDEKSACGFYVNHGIVLVGWDDTMGPNGAWILRNSWGPGWGDGGYMYIDRTVSNIGMFSTYVNYQATAPVLSSTPTAAPTQLPKNLSKHTFLPFIGG